MAGETYVADMDKWIKTIHNKMKAEKRCARGGGGVRKVWGKIEVQVKIMGFITATLLPITGEWGL